MEPNKKRRNNRTAGHNYERTKAREYELLYPGIATSRSCNRARDAQKVDLATVEESLIGRFPFNIQLKNSIGIKYVPLLNEIPRLSGIINVVIHKHTQKSGSRFMTTGEYAFMHEVDFVRLMTYRRAMQILSHSGVFEKYDELKELLNANGINPHFYHEPRFEYRSNRR